METYITWKPFYSVNHSAMDAEHQQIIACLNELYAAMNGGDATSAKKHAMDALVRYTRTHFENEEKVLRETGYPDFAAHKALHDDMRRRTAGLAANLNLATARDLLVFLKDWWLGHIQSEDKKYATYQDSLAVTR